MHLAFLTPEYPHSQSTPSGGLGTSIKNLAEQLAKSNIQVTIFIFGQEKDFIVKENSINLYFIRKIKYKFFGWYRYRKYLESYLNRVIKKEKISALEAPDWTGITAFIRLKCPLIIRMHGSDSYFCQLEGRPQKKKNFWFEKMALKHADHLISVSNFTALKTREIFRLKKEIMVIPNLIDIDAFKPFEDEPTPHTILYFGSIVRKKGLLELAHTFNIVHKCNPKIRLIMVGRDVIDIKTQRSTRILFEEILTEKARNNVLWTGNLPYNEVKQQISKAAVIGLPSFAEALPMTWLEAMAMEKALVTSNIGWAKEVMQNGETGFMVYPKNHSLFGKKILDLMENKDMALRMGKAARDLVIKKFSKEIVLDQNIRFYKKIIDTKSNEPI
ncbi:glycosyltransferase family 4 protein [Christiangramia sp. SM2212]|uniref:Glycosyltransferase family 4 protein n=1 Tax=Christiangramia sediminicola TaxID=3073267 RepID=A0ABU1EMS5_9FLAO|nr:glycosyltransferase family 4 protein [Christiangramia sp. SM2212]MDR5589685.1 glycosyltransferase family 4 protein [Christiangramia sp. SM2212]